MSDSDLALRKDVMMLAKFLQKLKEELATVRQNSDENDRFQSMSHKLSLITVATEEATNTILEAAESIEGAVARIDQLGNPSKEMFQQTNVVRNAVNNIFEASSFQDITGQRVNKVVTSLEFIDEAVDRMVELWGAEEISKVELNYEEDKIEEAGLLNGPASNGKGISQDEIDSFFS
jgi:chemotaxis protein CheZ